MANKLKYTLIVLGAISTGAVAMHFMDNYDINISKETQVVSSAQTYEKTTSKKIDRIEDIQIPSFKFVTEI